MECFCSSEVNLVYSLKNLNISEHPNEFPTPLKAMLFTNYAEIRFYSLQCNSAVRTPHLATGYFD